MTMTIRLYRAADKAACLALFNSNMPKFFAADERTEFDRFLDAPVGQYFVLEAPDGAIVGCGGYEVTSAGATAKLNWGMVDRARHRDGLGHRLLAHRIADIKADGSIRKIVMDTSQHVAGFFAEHGFRTIRVIPDGYKPGLDQVDMCLDL